MIANNMLLEKSSTRFDFIEPNVVDQLTRELEEKGAVRLPSLLDAPTVRGMQERFRRRLLNIRWNNCDGYERTESLRLMVQDVLTIDQGFVDLALHPLVKAVLDRYLGANYELCEAKGWRSLPTMKDFHGWHSDMWYDQTQVTERIPREVKVAFYLSDVQSGAFQYIPGTHGKQAPHHLKKDEVQSLPVGKMIEFLGSAGSAVMFDTSGIHRQGIPILEPRDAVFLNYHDPSVPLQAEDVEYYRYHPLQLNAAFLGQLTQEDMRILGFGNKTHYQPDFTRNTSSNWTHRFFGNVHAMQLKLGSFTGKVVGKLKRLVGR